MSALTELKFLFIAALKSELPMEWLTSKGIPIYSIKALQSGILNNLKRIDNSVLFIITGIGPDAARESGEWITNNLSPLFVLNIGTCGILNKKYHLRRWMSFEYAVNEEGCSIPIDTRLPLPYPDNITNVKSILTVTKPITSSIPYTWKKYDAVDMECFELAKIFKETGHHFHCLKFGSDYSDNDFKKDFKNNLSAIREAIKKLLRCFISKEEKRVSVVIPVHNRESTISSCIESVLNQTRKAEEIIVVNDGSTDSTGEIIDGYKDKIRTLHLTENFGVSRARNEGIKQSLYEWIAFLDSDDLWTRDKLNNQLNYLDKHPYYEILQSEEIWIRKGKRVNPCKHHIKPEGWIWEKSLERCLITASALLIKKNVLKKYGSFDKSLPACEDYDLWLKIARFHPVGLDPLQSVIKYGGHEDQLSQRYKIMDQFRIKSLLRLLENEKNDSFREKIITILKKKLGIVIQGCEKRNKTKESEEYQKLLVNIHESESGRQ